MHEIEASGHPVQDGAQTLKKDGMQTEASHLASGIQSSHEIEASGQPVQDSPQILKSHNIQKEVKRIVCVLLTSNANKFLPYYMKFWRHFNLANLAIFQKIAKLKCTKIKCR